MGERLIELRDIKKSYGSVFAVGGVNMFVDRGEVVGLLGDNGAGKSTLIKILAGAVRPSSGEILVRGIPVHGWSAGKSRDAGIETVFQDRALAVQQSIVRNIFMGREITTTFGLLQIRKEHSEAERLMREIGSRRRFSPPTRSSASCQEVNDRALRSRGQSTTARTLSSWTSRRPHCR